MQQENVLMVGQIWISTDSRSPHRRVRIEAIEKGPHGVDIVTLRNVHSQRKSTARASGFVLGTARYRLVIQ